MPVCALGCHKPFVVDAGIDHASRPGALRRRSCAGWPNAAPHPFFPGTFRTPAFPWSGPGCDKTVTNWSSNRGSAVSPFQEDTDLKLEKNGGSDRDRTCDPFGVNEVLSPTLT